MIELASEQPSAERRAELEVLESGIDYRFNEPRLLDRALTHRSYAHEHQGWPHNESMEFLGDAVLGLVVTDWLLELFPTLDEGRLAKMKARLVSKQTLETVARTVEIGRFLRLNRGEEKTSGREKPTILADALEAVTAAVFLDGGYAEARRFIRTRLAGEVASVDPADPFASDFKSALQERAQSTGHTLPCYRVAQATGPDHSRTFLVEVEIDGRHYAIGAGSSIKRAEQDAARIALGVLAAGGPNVG
jgi:ribonuclease-3